MAVWFMLLLAEPFNRPSLASCFWISPGSKKEAKVEGSHGSGEVHAAHWHLGSAWDVELVLCPASFSCIEKHASWAKTSRLAKWCETSWTTCTYLHVLLQRFEASVAMLSAFQTWLRCWATSHQSHGTLGKLQPRPLQSEFLVREVAVLHSTHSLDAPVFSFRVCGLSLGLDVFFPLHLHILHS